MGYFSSRGFLLPFLIFSTVFAAPTCWAFTDPRDVYAINSLYAALGSPKFLGWTGGDPCGLGWQGVQCVNANVTGLVLNGFNLSGQLTEDLGYLSSIIQIDLNDNHIGGPIPSSLPPTIRSLFLSNNKFTGGVPDAISSLGQLSELYLDNNLMTGVIPDAFQQLKGLVTIDFSGNKLGGQLPSSMGNLTYLTKLHLQNNQLTGTLYVLEDLPLTDLNIENNLFSGPIPEKLLTIPNFRKDGNPFNTSVLPSPPPPPSPSSPPPPPPPPIISSSPKPAPQSRQASAPPMVLVSDTGKEKAVKSSRIIMWIAIGLVATIALTLGIYVVLSQCCNKKPVPPEIKRSRGTNAHHSVHANPKSDDSRQKPVILKEDRKIDRERMDSGILPPPPPPFPHLSCESTIPDPILPLLNSGEHSAESVDLPRSFTVTSLEQYTDNFSRENLIGRGLLGTVYRVELPDGTVVAVKKLHHGISRRQSDEAFLNLVNILSKLQHANVVELVGHCSEQSKRLLVYEYCKNGKLHKALHVDNEMRAKLTWNTRIRLALEAARALEYLHETSQPPIVHQNFKTAKIFLEEDLTVRVSDCGLAPLLPSLSMAQLQRDGYGAPELEPGRYTSQSDVFSFGVVMLELVTGRKSHDESCPEEEQFLVRWAIPQLHDINALSRMVDPSLSGEYPPKSLSRFADIIFSCIQPEPEFRPPMSQVVQNLQQMVEEEQ